MLTTAQSYGLTFKVQQNGEDVTNTNIATLTAKINNLALTSGHSQPAYSQVDFALELSEDYYVVGWTGASNAEGNKTTSAKLNSLTEATTVIVNIQEKPKVTVATPQNGTVEVTGTRTGTGAVTLNGSSDQNGHVDLNSKVTIRATPTERYFVKNIVVTVDGVAQRTDYDTAENYKADAVRLEDIEITKDTSIQVNFAQKPVVTFTGDGNITVTAKQGDNELTSGQCVEKYSDDIVFTAKPNVVGYETASWTVDGQSDVSYQTVSGNDDTTYTKVGDIINDVTVEVKANSIPKKNLAMSVETIDAGGAHGKLTATVTRKHYASQTLNENGEFYRDSNLTITAVPDNGYRVQSWTIDGKTTESSALTQTLTKCQENASVTVRFVKLGAGITFTKEDTGGVITEAKTNTGLDAMPDAEKGVTLAENASITLTAEPQTGYEVKDWLVNGASKGTTSKTFTYTSDGNNGAHIAPVFQPVAYTINFGAAPSDKGTVIATGVTDGKARGGKSITFTADPGAGNKVIRWTINGEDQDGSGNTLTWTVPLGMPDSTSYDILAILTEDSFTLNYSAGEHGGLTATANGKTVESGATDVLGGTKVTFTATPEEHYEVDHWTVGGQTQNGGNTLDVTVVSNTTVSVTYKLKQYSVDLTQGANGTARATQTGSVNANTDVTFTATPAMGYHLKNWLVNGETRKTETNSLELTITGDTRVQPVFEIDALTVNYGLASDSKQARIQATVNGVALTSGSTVPYGSNVTFTVTPSGTDMVDSWSVNGQVDPENKMTETKDAETIYTVTNVTSSKDIQVKVIDRPNYTVTVADSITNGSVSIVGGENGTITVPRNGSVTLKATAKDVYHMFGSWIVNDTTLTDEKSAELKLDSIRKNTTVSATFRGAVSYNVTLKVDKTAVANKNVSVTVKNATNNQIIQPGATHERAASVLGGSKLVFTANDAAGNAMVGAWKINGQVQDNLSKEMVINGLTGATNVEVTFVPEVLYNIPSDGPNYNVTEIQKIPGDYGTEQQIRAGGTVEFVVKASDAGKSITEIKLNNCGDVTTMPQADGSMKVRVEKVTDNVTITVTVENGIPLTITPPSNGKIIVKNGDTELKSGAKVQKETILTITATPNSNYTLDQLTVDGATKQNDGTYKVNAKATALTVAATFKASSSGGGGGGGGGAVSTLHPDL